MVELYRKNALRNGWVDGYNHLVSLFHFNKLNELTQGGMTNATSIDGYFLFNPFHAMEQFCSNRPIQRGRGRKTEGGRGGP